MIKSLIRIALMSIVFSVHTVLCANAQSYMEPAPWDPDAPDQGTIEALSATANGSVERPSVVDGTQHTVVAPILRGEANNYSFIRLGNGGLLPTTFNVTVVGSPSGESYGTAEYEVAPWASPQYSIADILDEIGVSELRAEDNQISLYLKSPHQGNLPVFQHVVWNSMTGFFENASRCTFREDVDYSQVNRALINVHTSRIGNYPATVFLHNYADFEVTYRGNVFDARDGTLLGAVNFNMMANETRAVDFADIENEIDFVPESDQYHANIIFQEVDADDFYLLALQGIRNIQLEAFTNMSVACVVNPSSTSGFAPADQSAFDAFAVGKRFLSEDPSYYTDFISPGNFSEVENGETYTGRYTYENTGPNSGSIESYYDDGDRCTTSVTFESATTGSADFSCNDGSMGTESWRIEDIPTVEASGSYCRPSDVINPGGSCDIYDTSFEFAVDSDGRGCFRAGGIIVSCAGGSDITRNLTFNGVRITFVASRNDYNSWTIEDVSPRPPN